MDYHNAASGGFWIKDTIILSLLIGCAFFLFLGDRPLGVPDEGNYAEIIREMFVSGNFITPYLNEIKFFEKPILLYWLGSLALKVGGVNVWALRSINALLALLLCLITYLVGRHIYNRQIGWYASLILASNVLFFGLAHFITTDMTVTVFLSITLLSFLFFIKKNCSKPWALYIGAISTGLAMLAKGLIGLFLPGIILCSWIILTNEWRLLKTIPWIKCILLFCAIALPWHILVMRHNPEFFQIYFIEHHFLRFATRLVGHPQPLWYYLPVILIGFYPWVIFLPQTLSLIFQNIKHHAPNHQCDLFLLLWATIVIGFFTIATSKLISYILPAFPPLTLLIARFLNQSHLSKLKWALGLFILINIILSSLLLYISNIDHFLNAQKYFIYLSITLLIGSLISYIWLKKRQLTFVVFNIAFSTCISLIIGIVAIPSLDNRSIYSLTMILKKYRSPQDPVIAFNHFYQDLSFYLQDRIYILNSHKLLKKGMLHQKHHEWLLNDGNFNILWQTQPNVFAIMHTNEFQQLPHNYPNLKYVVVAKTRSDVLIKNQETLLGSVNNSLKK